MSPETPPQASPCSGTPEPGSRRVRERDSLILTGFMGTGKSAVGRSLARLLRRSFLDTDEMIESKAGKAIPEIFEEQGEESFRRLEREVVREVAAARRCVVATGGGALLDETNRGLLQRAGWIVCLRASPETILERAVVSANERPLLASSGREDRLKEIRRLLAEREPAYASADLTVSADRPLKEVVEEIRLCFERWRAAAPEVSSP